MDENLWSSIWKQFYGPDIPEGIIILHTHVDPYLGNFMSYDMKQFCPRLSSNMKENIWTWIIWYLMENELATKRERKMSLSTFYAWVVMWQIIDNFIDIFKWCSGFPYLKG